MLSAQVVRLGFQDGAFDRADVQAWVDEVVGEVDAVPAGLLELVPLTGLDDSEIDAHLARMGGALAPDEEARIRVDLTCDSFRRGRRTIRETASTLERIAIRYVDELPSDVQFAASRLDDAFALAEGGYCGTVAEAEADLLAFVETFGRPIR